MKNNFMTYVDIFTDDIIRYVTKSCFMLIFILSAILNAHEFSSFSGVLRV